MGDTTVRTSSKVARAAAQLVWAPSTESSGESVDYRPMGHRATCHAVVLHSRAEPAGADARRSQRCHCAQPISRSAPGQRRGRTQRQREARDRASRPRDMRTPTDLCGGCAGEPHDRRRAQLELRARGRHAPRQTSSRMMACKIINTNGEAMRTASGWHSDLLWPGRCHT